MGVCISQCKKTTTKTIMTPKKRTLRIIFGQTKIDERIIIMNSHSQMMVYENDGRIRLMKLIFFSFISIKKKTHTHNQCTNAKMAPPPFYTEKLFPLQLAHFKNEMFISFFVFFEKHGHYHYYYYYYYRRRRNEGKMK